MRQCNYCSGRLESKGIRGSRRRYRCTVCHRNAASVALTDAEIKRLRDKDAGIGKLSLDQREAEIKGLQRKRNAYALLPQYDPKYLQQIHSLKKKNL